MSCLRQLNVLAVCVAIASSAFAGVSSDKCVYLIDTSTIKAAGAGTFDLTGADNAVCRLEKSDDLPILHTAAISPEYGKKESQPLANTKPSLPIADYLGTYENEVHGQAR